MSRAQSFKPARLLSFAWPLLLLAGLWIYQQSRNGGAGQKLYTLHCAACHMEDGSGLGANIPALAQSPSLNSLSDAELACISLRGIGEPRSVGGVQVQRMPGNATLSAAELRSLIEFIRGAWGNTGRNVSFQEISAAWDSCHISP